MIYDHAAASRQTLSESARADGMECARRSMSALFPGRGLPSLSGPLRAAHAWRVRHRKVRHPACAARNLREVRKALAIMMSLRATAVTGDPHRRRVGT